VIPEPRTLKVGATENVWARSTEKAGQDLTGVTVSLREVAPDGTVGDWAAPADVDLDQAEAGIVRAAVSHVAAVTGWWSLDIRLVDAGETVIQRAGTFNVVA
jgi:hypothetical protein